MTAAGEPGWLQAYADLAAQVRAAPARLGGCRLVAVDGPSGAGKSSFADRLAAMLGVGTTMVHTDDLLDGWADELTFWPRLQRWVLDPLRAGRPGRYRRYDWHRGRFGADWTVVPPASVVVLDGVSSARAVIRPHLTLAVFVTAPAEVRLARSLARDGAQAQRHLQTWRAVERQHFAVDATEQHADLVVDGAAAGPHDPRVHFARLR